MKSFFRQANTRLGQLPHCFVFRGGLITQHSKKACSDWLAMASLLRLGRSTANIMKTSGRKGPKLPKLLSKSPTMQLILHQVVRAANP